MSDKVTLLIQGKLHKNTIKMCDFHKELNIVISTWGSEKEVIDFIGKSMRPNIKIVAKELPRTTTDHRNESNRLYHFASTFNGLETIETEFTIKVRTDEYYSHLVPLIAMVHKEPEKIITNNVFFRKTNFYMYHPSDHLLAGKTKNLLEVFRECKHTAETVDMFRQDLRPEQMIGTVYVIQKEKATNKNFRINLHKNEEGLREATVLMKKYFNVINTQILGEFEVTANSFKKEWNTLAFTDIRYDVVDSMEELI